MDKRLVGKWEIVEADQKGTATFTDGGTVWQIDFVSNDELLVHRPKGCNFTWLYGRLKRLK